jgi:adenylate cyclase
MERILASQEFQKANRLKDFLQFIVEETLAGRSESIKAYTIAIDVFGRPQNFDPVTDTIVRVQAGKLRRALDRYYYAEGNHDPIRIEVPKGSYVPVFQRREPAQNDASANCVDPSARSDGFPLPPRIAVVPFANLTGDPSNEFFVDGLGEELSAELARFSGIEVIAYYSMSRFKGKRHDLQDLGKDLGTMFAITGSIYRASQKFRINVQLSRTDTSEQVWAHRFDRALTADNLFDVQEIIVQRVVAAVADDYAIIPKILAKASRGKRVEDLSVYEAVLRYHHYSVTLTVESFEMARQALENAVRTDLDYALAWAMLGMLYLDAYTFSLGEIDNAVERGTGCAGKATAVDPLCQHAYLTAGYVKLLGRDRNSVLHSARKIVELNPNAAYMVGAAGWFMAVAGEYDQGLPLLDKSMKLNPYYPTWFHFPYYLDHYRNGDYEKALEEAERFGLPDFFWNPLLHAAALGQLGLKKQAHAAYQQLLRLQPDFPEQARFYVSCFVMQDDLIDRMLEGLKKAGLTES